MPNEPVQCPNCGSGDVRQLAPESYVCEHCHTNFRWVDPTKKTVVHKPSLCECGRAVVGACWRCQRPLCGTCAGAAGDFYRSLADLFRHLPRSLCQTLESHNIPDNFDVLLCKKCNSECCVNWESAARWLRQEGLVCARCYDPESDYPGAGLYPSDPGYDWTRIQMRCVACGLGFCKHHHQNIEGQECRICKGLHDPATYEGVAEQIFQQTGKYPTWDPLKRTPNETTADRTTEKPAGCAGVLLAIVFACAMAGLGLWATLS